jgi:hypothetical protein
MIDRAARDALKDALQAMATGRITADEFVDRIERLESSDPAIQEVFEALVDCYYDDIGPGRFAGRYRLGREARRKIARVILFLRSEREYEWPPSTRDSCTASIVWMTSFPAFVAGVLVILGGLTDGLWLKEGIMLAVAGVVGMAGTVWASVRAHREWESSGDAEAWPYIRQADDAADRFLPRSAA